MSTGDHLSDEALAAWAEGTAPAALVELMTAHVAGCDGCRSVLSALSRSQERASTRIGRYELREKVGAGGMGVVWAAWDPSLSRRVAMKISHQRREASDARFLHERHILAGLEHPHIARLLDAGETADQRPWFAMDFVDGLPIDQYVEQQQLSTRARVELFLPVLGAVQYAHRHLVVHRDLKPANILVDAAGQPRLVDFGIARLLERDLSLTQTGHNPMTPAWASPEQVRGERVTTSSDVFSLGVVLYQLLSGTSPWPAPEGDLDALLRDIRQTEPKACSHAAPPQHARELEGDLDAVVAMALRKEPQDRYASADAFADDLRSYLEGGVTQARRGDRRYRIARFVRRHRLAVGAVVGVFFSLAAGLTATAWQTRAAQRQRDRAEHRFSQVRSLAHAVLFDYHDGIANLPGSTPLRERLVKDAVGYLDSLAGEVQEDLSLQRELAAAWLKVGDVQGDPFSGSLGDTDGAAKSYRRGQALAQGVLKVAPADREARATLAQSEEKLGALEEVAGKLDDAAAAYQRARALQQTLVEERPEDAALRYQLSRTELALGQVRMQQNKLAEARAAVEASLASRRASLALVRSPLHLQGLAAALNTQADLDQQQGHNTQALVAWDEAVTLFDEALKRDPLSASARRGRMVILGALAAGFIFEGQYENALERTSLAVAQARQDLKDDPQNAVVVRDLGTALQTHGQALGGLERYDEAFAALEEAKGIFAGLLEREPTAIARRDLVITLLREGYVAMAAKRVERGLAAFTAGQEATRPLLEGDPANATVREWAADGHYGVGNALRAQGRLEPALTEVRAAQQNLRSDAAGRTRQRPASGPPGHHAGGGRPPARGARKKGRGLRDCLPYLFGGNREEEGHQHIVNQIMQGQGAVDAPVGIEKGMPDDEVIENHEFDEIMIAVGVDIGPDQRNRRPADQQKRVVGDKTPDPVHGSLRHGCTVAG